VVTCEQLKTTKPYPITLPCAHARKSCARQERQKIIGNYIVDFYCAEKSTIIELDGSSHDGKEDYDKKRDDFFVSLGLRVIHITVVDVLSNMGGVLAYLKNHPALAGTPPGEGN